MTKNQELLAYIIKDSGNVSLTSLMKLSYFIDLVSFKTNKEQISDFEYIRYKYGPFDNKIYNELKALLDSKIISDESEFTQSDEYHKYIFNGPADHAFETLNASDITLIDGVLNQLRGYGAKTLTEAAYKTKPMLALKATLGGTEGLLEKLDLGI